MKLIKYIGIVNAKFPLSPSLFKKGNIMGNYKLILDSDKIFHMKCRNYFEDILSNPIINTSGFRDKTTEKYWLNLEVDRKNSDIIKGNLIFENSDEVLYEIKFFNPNEVNKTYKTWTDENNNQTGKYLHNYEKFNVPFEILCQ